MGFFKKSAIFLLLVKILILGLFQTVNLVYAVSLETKEGNLAKNNAAGQRCFLWKVVSPSNTVYLLGSIHIARRDIYPLNKKIEDAFNISDVLAVEADITKITQDSNSMKDVILYPDGDILEKHISKDTFEIVKSKLKELGVDINEANKYKPWFLAGLLEMFELQKLGFHPMYGIDNYFLSKAKFTKKSITGLESLDFHIKFFDSFSDKLKELMLFYTIKDLEESGKTIDELFNAWLSGDTETMEQTLSITVTQYPETQVFQEKILYERNRNMAEKIEDFLKEERIYFVVVGAAHLVGKKSIIDLLAQKGYNIQQL